MAHCCVYVQVAWHQVPIALWWSDSALKPWGSTRPVCLCKCCLSTPTRSSLRCPSRPWGFVGSWGSTVGVPSLGVPWPCQRPLQSPGSLLTQTRYLSFFYVYNYGCHGKSVMYRTEQWAIASIMTCSIMTCSIKSLSMPLSYLSQP